MATLHPLLLREAACAEWDSIVIGAGPAGSLVARQVALAGLKTLLIDAKRFPREKVCGGYLNRRALAALQLVGLLPLAGENSESQVQRVEMRRGAQRAIFPLPAGRVICRNTFDEALANSAQKAGVSLLTDAQAVIEPISRDSMRSVAVNQQGCRELLSTRVVICADGLTRTSLRKLPEFTVEKSPTSRVGIGAIVSAGDDLNPVGQITMVVSRRGYVGISRVNREQLNIAAAIDQELLSQAPPAKIVREMLVASGVAPPIDLDAATWRGTPPLTSRPNQVAWERVFLIGDAAGYVEPFTGEGMAAALETALAVSPLVVQASSQWDSSLAERWTSMHRQIVGNREFTCRQLAWVLRRPWAARAAMVLCRSLPKLAGHFISRTTIPCPAYTQLGIGTP